MFNESIGVETSKLGSYAEEKFMEIFIDTFGPENIKYLSIQHPFLDIYNKRRYIDFAIINDNQENIAIEIDGETYHNPKFVSEDKYIDDLEKQNSLIYFGWKLYKWSYREINSNFDKIKDEMQLFIGDSNNFKKIDLTLDVVELREHQSEALKNLEKIRCQGKIAALLNHATGTGKTVIAISDAKKYNGKTLFIAQSKDIVRQTKKEFEKIWNQEKIGIWMGEEKEDAKIICATVQSLSRDLDLFDKDEFDYIIVDEAHHAAADIYKKVLNYFQPKFLLGLTATMDRTDGKDILDIFGVVGHKLDIKKAIELGQLVPIRCIRVKTNIDIRDVRFNGIKYNFRDLENKLFIPERNQIILDTYEKFVIDKKTVVFCASVDHAKEISELFNRNGICAKAVYGSMDYKERINILDNYENGNLNILCACDLLNEGWDSPRTEVLFMARPTLSKLLYEQQLGRGLRLYNGKEYLMVFDFIDNANMFNVPYSVHRIFNLDKYIEGEEVVGKNGVLMEKSFTYKGEKPEIELDYPVRAMDYELIDLFDWQLEIEDMVSEIEFVRKVNIQSETINRYIKDKKIIPDMKIPMGSRTFNYFKEDTISKYVEEFGWKYITSKNIKNIFMEFIQKMDMSYSYKPVFIMGFLENMDEEGRANIDELVEYFIEYYEDRKKAGLVVEKKKCLYLREYTKVEVKRNILSNPFKRFEDMNFMKYHKDIEYIKLDGNIFRYITEVDIDRIKNISKNKLNKYYNE